MICFLLQQVPPVPPPDSGAGAVLGAGIMVLTLLLLVAGFIAIVPPVMLCGIFARLGRANRLLQEIADDLARTPRR
jgi:hypothetical protein